MNRVSATLSPPAPTWSAAAATSCSAALRGRATPIIARIEGKRLLIDLRTVLEEQDSVVEQALVALAVPADDPSKNIRKEPAIR